MKSLLLLTFLCLIGHPLFSENPFPKEVEQYFKTQKNIPSAYDLEDHFNKVKVTTLGSETVFNAGGSTVDNRIAALSSTKFALVYQDRGNNFYGTAIIGDISGTDITFGIEYPFTSANAAQPRIAALSSTQVAIVYAINPNDNGEAIIGNVSGNTILFASAYDFNAANTTFLSIAPLNSTQFVVAYRDNGNSSKGTTRIGNVTGTMINFDSETIFNDALTKRTTVNALSSTSFVVTFIDEGNSDYGTATVGSVSGTTTTYGSEYTFNPSTTVGQSAIALNATDFAIAYRDNGNSGYGTAIIGSVSGNLITYGSEAVFNMAISQTTEIAKFKSNHIIISYRDDGNSSYGTTIEGQIDGSNNIEFGTESVYNNALTNQTFIVNLGETHFVVAYADGGQGSNGYAVAGETCSDPTSSFSANTVTAGIATSFTDASTNVSGSATYSWDFDNNGTEDATTVGNTDYTYPSVGSYTAKLTVTNDVGCISETTVNVTVDAALPVELIFFKAQKKDKQSVSLNWQTANEDNNKGFQIQRSTDGRNWQNIAYLEGNGTVSERSNYTYIDETPQNGFNYYRLRQEDFDGAQEYSEVKVIYLDKEIHQIALYPNPVLDNLTIEYGLGTIQVYNWVGQLMLQDEINIQPFKINMSTLTPGLYILVVTPPGQKSIHYKLEKL